MSEYIVDGQDLSTIANTIRNKTGNSNALVFPSDFISEIENITTENILSGIQKKEGSIVIETNCESFTIETGLTTVHTIIVRGSGGSVSNTYAWNYDDSGKGLSSCQYRSQYMSSDSNNKITIDGGSVICTQYSSSYPIVAKTFNWVAYGE